MQTKRIVPLSLLSLFLVLGCAVPAIPFLDSAPTEPAPITIDADTLATMVADAAAQKVAQTQQAVPPTVQPTATTFETLLPTATPTEIPATETATPLVLPETGSALIPVENAHLYYDYTGDYMLTTPANWLTVRPGEVEYTEAWGLPISAYPEVKTALQNMQSLDPNSFRLFVLDTQEGHFDNSFLSNINLLSAPANGATLDEIFAQSVIDLPEAIPGSLVTDSGISEHVNGLRMGVITSEWDSQLAYGETLRLYQKQVIFVISDRSLIITFTSTADFKDTILADFDTMVDNLTILE